MRGVRVPVLMAFLLLNTAAVAQIGRIYIPGLEAPYPDSALVTYSPADEVGPAVSPDGRWIVFVAERAGNRDLWMKPLRGGRPIRLTAHPAADESPVWGGKNTLYFVSRRRDVLGDIWKMVFSPQKVPERHPRLKPFIQMDGFEGEVSVSPDFRRIAFVHIARDSAPEIRIAGKKGRSVRIGTGMWPAWSPDGRWLACVEAGRRSRRQNRLKLYFFGTGKGRTSPLDSLFFRFPAPVSHPFWDRQAEALFLFSYEIDTNRDGIRDYRDAGWFVRIPVKDILRVWEDSLRFRLLVGPAEFSTFRRVHLGYPGQFFPPASCVDGAILVAARSGGQSDLVRLPLDALLIRRAHPGLFVTEADSLWDLAFLHLLLADSDSSLLKDRHEFERQFILHKVGVLQQQADLWPGTGALPAVWLELARLYRRLGWMGAADRSLRQILRKASRTDPLWWHARAERLALVESAAAVAESLSSWLEGKETPASVRGTLRALRGVFRFEAGHQGEARRDLLRVVSGHDLAPAILKKVLDCLEQTYRREGTVENILAVRAEAVFRSYSETARQLAALKWARLFIAHFPDSTLPEKVRTLTGERETRQELQAAFLWTKGEVYRNGGQVREALRLWADVFSRFGKSRWIWLKSLLGILDVLRAKGQWEKALEIVREAESSGRLAPPEERYLRQLGYRLQLEHIRAAEMETPSDVRSRIRLLQELISREPVRSEGHRVLVELAKGRGMLEEVESWYRMQVKEHPNISGYRYGLALCLFSHPDAGRDRLIESNQQLRLCLAKSPHYLEAFYQLARNAERLEILERERQKKKPGFFLRVARSVAAPGIWLVRRIRGYRPAGARDWLERGIEAARAALELNDERHFPAREAELLEILGNLSFRMGGMNYERAFHAYRSRLELDSTFTSPLEKATFFRRMGFSALRAHEPEVAVRLLERALDLYRSLREDGWANRTEKWLAEAYRETGAADRAALVLRSALRYDRAYRGPEEQVQTYYRLAESLLETGKLREAVDCILQGLELLDSGRIQRPSASGSALRLEVLGYTFPIWNVASLSTVAGRQMYGLSPDDQRALFLELLLQLVQQQQRPLTALILLREKLEAHREAGELLGECVTWNRLGLLYAQMGQYRLSLEAFEKALERGEKLGDIRAQGLILANIFNLFCRMVQADSLMLEGKQSAVLSRVWKKADAVQAVLEREPELTGRQLWILRHQRAALDFLLWQRKKGLKSYAAALLFPSRQDTLRHVLENVRGTVRLARQLGLEKEEGLSRLLLADMFAAAGFWADAGIELDRAMEIFQKNAYPVLLAVVGIRRALLEFVAGDRNAALQKALQIREQALLLAEETGIPDNGLFTRSIGAAFELEKQAAFRQRKIRRLIEVQEEETAWRRFVALQPLISRLALRSDRPSWVKTLLSFRERFGELREKRSRILRRRLARLGELRAIEDSLDQLRREWGKWVEQIGDSSRALLPFLTPRHAGSRFAEKWRMFRLPVLSAVETRDSILFALIVNGEIRTFCTVSRLFGGQQKGNGPISAGKGKGSQTDWLDSMLALQRDPLWIFAGRMPVYMNIVESFGGREGRAVLLFAPSLWDAAFMKEEGDRRLDGKLCWVGRRPAVLKNAKKKKRDIHWMENPQERRLRSCGDASIWIWNRPLVFTPFEGNRTGFKLRMPTVGAVAAKYGVTSARSRDDGWFLDEDWIGEVSLPATWIILSDRSLKGEHPDFWVLWESIAHANRVRHVLFIPEREKGGDDQIYKKLLEVRSTRDLWRVFSFAVERWSRWNHVSRNVPVWIGPLPFANFRE